MSDINVAIVTMERTAILRDTLESLGELGLLEETLVVDGSKDNETKSVCEDFGVEYRQQKSKGMTSARNEALEHCDSDYIAFIDDDCRVSDTWYETIQKCFEVENVVGVTGKLEGEELELSGLGKNVRDFLFGSRENFGQVLDNGVIKGDFFYNQKKEVDHMPGCNMAYHVPTLKQAGGFDENVDVGNSYREDTIASYRVSREGKVVYHPDASVDHLAVQEEGDHKKWMLYNPYLTRYFLESNNIIKGVKNWLSHLTVTKARHIYFFGQSLKNLNPDYFYYLYGELRGFLDFTVLGREPRKYI